MPTWKLTLEYDGTDFSGWQRQLNGITVQEVLENALTRIHSGEEARMVAAGRTDAGVHARGQVVSFTTSRVLKLNSYERGLSTYLPLSVAVRHAEIVPDGFDARRWARGKRYEYRILRSRLRSPLRDRYTWMVHGKLDVNAMREAGALLIGRHDFGSFRASNCDAKTTVREIRQLVLVERDDELVLTFEGSAFLRHMVRNLVGTLQEVGAGKREPASITRLLTHIDRTVAGPTAPACGLCLDEVFYDLAAGPLRRDRTTDADD